MQDTEYEDEWAADKQATDAQDAADQGVAAGKKADAESDFEFADAPGTLDKASAAKPAATPATKSFKETFKAARDAGAKDFEWKRPDGSAYRVTTALKSDAAKSATSPRVTASPPAGKPAPSVIKRPEPRASMTQKLGSDYAAVKQAADTMPAGTSAAARSALNESVGRSQRAYEHAASADKAGTPVVKRASPAPKPLALRVPDHEDDGIGPVYFNQPGGTLLSGGKARGESAIIPDTRVVEAPTPRRGYKS